jgi:hypothetical protein
MIQLLMMKMLITTEERKSCLYAETQKKEHATESYNILV